VTPNPPALPGCGFHLVFDASQKGPDLWFSGFGLIFVVIGVVVLAAHFVPRIAFVLTSRERAFHSPGVYFAYSDYVVTPGFNNTSSHGGPMREGLYVRIHYTGSVTGVAIVKLEVRDCR
jgi:hypothetical protein